MSAFAATLHGPEDLRLDACEPGPLQPGMVRIRFGAGGICGSDLHYFRHARTGDFVVSSPLILGHEVAGEVVEINGDAPGLVVGGLVVGDRVAVNPSRFCGRCRYCAQRRPNLCENIYFMGSASRTPHMQGGFASLFDATPAQCVKVPATVPYTAAALAEPLAVCLHAAARAGDLAGSNVVVFGAGPIGLLTMLAAKLRGCHAVTMVDIAAAPLALAERLGAERVLNVNAGDDGLRAAAKDEPFDVAFEVTGTPAGLASAIASVRRGGVLVQVGNLPGGQVPVPMGAVMAKELDIRATFRFAAEFNEAVELIATGAVDVLRLVTAERALSSAQGAFRLALDRSKSVKVMLSRD